MPNPGTKIHVEITADSAKATQQIAAFFDSIKHGAEHLREAAKFVAEFASVAVGFEALREAGAQVLEMGTQLQNLKARTGGSIADLVIMQRQLKETGGGA